MKVSDPLSVKKLFFNIKSLIFLYIYSISGGQGAMVHVWRSEGNLQELVHI